MASLEVEEEAVAFTGSPYSVSPALTRTGGGGSSYAAATAGTPTYTTATTDPMIVIRYTTLVPSGAPKRRFRRLARALANRCLGSTDVRARNLSLELTAAVGSLPSRPRG